MQRELHKMERKFGLRAIELRGEALIYRYNK